MDSVIKKLWVRRILLVFYDMAAVVFSTYFALLARFDFSLAAVPEQYYTIALDTVIPNFIITIIVFYSFRLYTSLWTYAGATELMYMLGKDGLPSDTHIINVDECVDALMKLLDR